MLIVITTSFLLLCLYNWLWIRHVGHHILYITIFGFGVSAYTNRRNSGNNDHWTTTNFLLPLCGPHSLIPKNSRFDDKYYKTSLQDDIPIQRQGNHHDLRLRRMKTHPYNDKELSLDPPNHRGCHHTEPRKSTYIYTLEPLPTKTTETLRHFPLLNSSLPFKHFEPRALDGGSHLFLPLLDIFG